MNMMEKIKVPQLEINLSEWQGAGISERETKKRAMELLGVDNKGWKKLKDEDKLKAKDIVYQNTDKEKPVQFLNMLSDEIGVDMREGLFDAVITNVKNPAYRKIVTSVVGGVLLERVYELKLANGATNPNITTQKNGRVKINKDYIVTVTATPVSFPTLITNAIDYKFGEDEYIRELAEYIDGTYNSHYSSDLYQATEFIIDGGHGTGFCIGNVMKYAQRYGKKGDAAQQRKDLLKILHYAIIQLRVHDLNEALRPCADID
tara:strand:+ start:1815 stop:2597 length:783 start_codon:yes stop_codon:yes gene_type:complete